MAKIIILDGRLGRDAEYKQLQNGTAMLTFSVATNRWDGKENQTDWIPCTLFGKRAESALKDKLVKGASVALSGTFNTRKATNKQGAEVTYYGCSVDEITVSSVGEYQHNKNKDDVFADLPNQAGLPESDDIPF